VGSRVWLWLRGECLGGLEVVGGGVSVCWVWIERHCESGFWDALMGVVDSRLYGHGLRVFASGWPCSNQWLVLRSKMHRIVGKKKVRMDALLEEIFMRCGVTCE
jgi:hypothetical protein